MSDEQDRNAMTPDHHKSEQKKPYVQPQLRVYGDVSQITQTSTASNKHEGSSKTSPARNCSATGGVASIRNSLVKEGT